jgi:hypothetical protein
LGEAGVTSHCTSNVAELATIAPREATAAVIFPDGFADAEVIALVRRLRRARPELCALLITRKPQRFASVLQADGRSVPPIVLPTPSFGWEILDAIRAHDPTASKGSTGPGG